MMRMKRNKITLMGWILLAGFCIYAIVLLVPLVWGIYTSFKTPHNFTEDPIGLPNPWSLQNFSNVMKEFSFKFYENGQQYETTLLGMYINSFLYSFGTSFISTATCCAVAYVTAIFSWKFSKIIYSLVVVIMIVPIVGSLPAQLNLLRALRFYDSMLGIYATSFSFAGIGYLLFFAAFQQTSKGYIEAGKIDGASNLHIMLQLMLPMVWGIFFTLFLQSFIGKWNDYQTAMLYLPSYPTVAQGIYSFSFSSVGTIANVPSKLTGCMLLLLPVLIIFILFNKKLLINVSIGGMKE